MGFSRKEVYYWLETASNEQLQAHLRNSQEMLVLLTDREQIKSLSGFAAASLRKSTPAKKLNSLKRPFPLHLLNQSFLLFV